MTLNQHLAAGKILLWVMGYGLMACGTLKNCAAPQVPKVPKVQKAPKALWETRAQPVPKAHKVHKAPLAQPAPKAGPGFPTTGLLELRQGGRMAKPCAPHCMGERASME